MDCLILAGGTPKPASDLYKYTAGKPKALLEVNCRSMLATILDVMQSMSEIDDILIVGLTPDEFSTPSAHVFQLPDQGSLVQNGIAGLKWLKNHRQEPRPVVLCTVDIPLITREIVTDVIANCRPFDHAIYYHFVTRPVMEARFPNSKRTFVKLKDQEVAGADLMIAQSDLADDNEALWEALTNGRKHAWKLARVVGPIFLVKFLLRKIDVKDIEATATRILQKPVKIILTPHAEIGMDVDKADHLAVIQK